MWLRQKHSQIHTHTHCELFDEKSTTRNEEIENNNDDDDNNDYDNIKKLTHFEHKGKRTKLTINKTKQIRLKLKSGMKKHMHTSTEGDRIDRTHVRMSVEYVRTHMKPYQIN